MPIVQHDDLGDLVLVALRHLGRAKWTSIAEKLQEYVAVQQILKKKRMGFVGGRGLQFNIFVNTSGQAKHLGLFETDSSDVSDVMAQGTVPWKHAHTKWDIEVREPMMDSGPAQIVDLVKIRKFDALLAFAEELEAKFWAVPASASDDPDPFGIDYWLVKNATEGFNGGNHPNFSGGPAGIDRTVTKNANWKNYTFQYITVNKTDLVRKWRKAMTLTRFISPVPHASYESGGTYGFYTNYNVIGPLEEALEAQNDRLGNDIASMDGKLVMQRIPVTWVPQLETDSQDPLYGINWNVMKPVFLTADYLRETGPYMPTDQHNVRRVYTDLTYQYVCYDPRKMFIGNIA